MVLLGVAVALTIAELLLPSMGVFGLLALAAVVGAIIVAFTINLWLGAGLLIGLAVLAPFLFQLFMALWQRTPIGRKMVLTSTVGEAQKSNVLIGSVGRSISELRPTGECEFDGKRVEAMSETGQVIGAGMPVKIVAMVNQVATVRAISA